MELNSFRMQFYSKSDQNPWESVDPVGMSEEDNSDHRFHCSIPLVYCAHNGMLFLDFTLLRVK